LIVLHGGVLLFYCNYARNSLIDKDNGVWNGLWNIEIENIN